MCVEYSYITGLSLTFPLKVSRALVSVCLLGHVSVRKGGWCVVYLALCTRETLVSMYRSSACGYQPIRQTHSPNRTFLDHSFFAIIILWIQIILGLNRFTAMTADSGLGALVAESQKSDDYWNVVTSPSWGASVTLYWHKWPSSHHPDSHTS